MQRNAAHLALIPLLIAAIGWIAWSSRTLVGEAAATPRLAVQACWPSAWGNRPTAIAWVVDQSFIPPPPGSQIRPPNEVTHKGWLFDQYVSVIAHDGVRLAVQYGADVPRHVRLATAMWSPTSQGFRYIGHTATGSKGIVMVDANLCATEPAAPPPAPAPAVQAVAQVSASQAAPPPAPAVPAKELAAGSSTTSVIARLAPPMPQGGNAACNEDGAVQICAWVSNVAPRPGEPVAVFARLYDNGIAQTGMPMIATWRYPSYGRTCYGMTNSDGMGVCSRDAGAALHSEVVIDVVVFYNGWTYTATTSLTPR